MMAELIRWSETSAWDTRFAAHGTGDGEGEMTKERTSAFGSGKLREIEELALSNVIGYLDPDLSQILREQIRKIEVTGRTRSEIGFVTYFRVDDDVPLVQNKRLVLDGSGGRIGETDVGFSLFIEGGKIQSLEGYTYGGKHYPQEIENRFRAWSGVATEGNQRHAPWYRACLWLVVPVVLIAILSLPFARNIVRMRRSSMDRLIELRGMGNVEQKMRSMFKERAEGIAWRDGVAYVESFDALARYIKIRGGSVALGSPNPLPDLLPEGYQYTCLSGHARSPLDALIWSRSRVEPTPCWFVIRCDGTGTLVFEPPASTYVSTTAPALK